MKYCVYKHTSPSGKVYIGITRNDPIKRWQNGTGYRTNDYFTKAIKKYGWENFEHEILYERLTEEQAKEKEKYLILKHKSNQRKYGYNISSGGESRSGTSLTEEHKEKIRQANLGKKVSQETRRKLSASSTRRWKDAGYIQHMREINSGINNKMYGKKMSDKEKLKRNAKPVEQYDLNGRLIKEYISIRQASDQTKVHRDGIKKCCIGKFKTSGGYVWKFKNIDYQKKG